ncbi:MAG TPA: DUF1592 domain-containing protein [Myxococcaceae bacterium]|nr:DUF1592 domain-containing protein [Myxococcaceae bacterium]
MHPFFHSRGWHAAALAGATCALLLHGCSDELPLAKVLPPIDTPSPPDGTDPDIPGGDGEEPPPPSACQGPVDPGRVPLHRLNRAEYDNTVRDLLGDTTRPARDFPADDHGYGYDNNATILSLSPLLMEKYATTAARLVEEAWQRDATSTKPMVRICTPAVANPEPCGRKILERFARRAWRRPVTPQEVDRLMGFLELARAHGESFDAGMKLALRSVLVSPHFLFRVEVDPEPHSTQPHALNDWELASRLSYFLWSTMPDDKLMAAAEAGKLSTPEELEQQVRRMLKDPKAQALVDNFAGQWLHTRALAYVNPDPTYVSFDEPLREAMRQEIELFFREFLRGDRPVRDMLDADFTYLNDRLADHYGLPRPGTSEMKRVSVAGHPERAGLLGKGALLTVTSHPERTSPVRRGVWVLEQLLCKPPPPPPPNVPDLPGVDINLSVREQMRQHREDPACAGCHAMMDPIGYGLESFNVVGAWRLNEEYSGAPIDSSGQLPTGQSFQGVVELRGILKEDPHLTTCVAEHLLIYGLGRGTLESDQCLLEQVVQEAEARNGSLTDLIISLVRSVGFTHRRGEPNQEGEP